MGGVIGITKAGWGEQLEAATCLQHSTKEWQSTVLPTASSEKDLTPAGGEVEAGTLKLVVENNVTPALVKLGRWGVTAAKEVREARKTKVPFRLGVHHSFCRYFLQFISLTGMKTFDL